MESYALRDRVGHQDLMRFLDDASEMFFEFIEVNYGNAIEEFLDEYNYEFTEWCEYEGVDMNE